MSIKQHFNKDIMLLEKRKTKNKDGNLYKTELKYNKKGICKDKR